MLPVLYQDDNLIVINKPAGLPVHAGSGGGETVETFLPALQGTGKQVPHLAHRLDRDTSGCLILGRHKQALRHLGRLFEQKRIHKTYWAIVSPVPDKPQGVIDQPLAKQTQDKRRWHMKVDESGQQAITHYRVLGRTDTHAWVEMTPKTGRTHQLRVHCQFMGWPIVGDPFYGPTATPDVPLMLHARSLVIPYPATPPQPALTIQAPPPPHMLALLKECGFSS